MKVTDGPVKAPIPSQSGSPPNREIVEPVASRAKAGQASDVGLPASHAESGEENQAAAGERQHPSARAFIKRHAVLIFYLLVFALAWGLILINAGPGAFVGTTDLLGTDAELASAAEVDPFMMAGAPIYLLVTILVIALAFGRAGLRDLRSRLFRWRVDVRWYAVALLTYPLLTTAILFALSLTSDAYLPGIVTAEDKATLLVTGLVAGLFAGFFEEIAWTGFATHELSKRHGLLATGLIVGLPWGLVHLPLIAGADSGAVPQALAVAVALFAVMLPYRVLMVWVYSHTQSVLLAMLMHLPITAATFILVDQAAMAGVPDLIFNLVFSATLWVLVAAVAAADRRKLSLVT